MADAHADSAHLFMKEPFCCLNAYIVGYMSSAVSNLQIEKEEQFSCLVFHLFVALTQHFNALQRLLKKSILV